MKLINLQEMTPDVYTEESRDFQLLLRLFDCTFNSVKFDIDSMLNIVDSATIKTDLLSLLQTKLGFFTDIDIDDTALRYILRVFPILLKHKGSTLAVEQLINTYLKIYNISSRVYISCINEGVIYRGLSIDDHSIVIELSNAINKTNILTEVFRYILPTGYGFYLYFYDTVSQVSDFNVETSAELLFVSDNLESEVRGNFARLSGGTWGFSDPYLAIDSQNKMIGAIDLFEIESRDSFTPTRNGTYEPGDFSKYKGIVIKNSGETPIQALNRVITDKTSNDLAIVDSDFYIYSSGWKKITFKGIQSVLPQTETDYTVIGVNSRNVYKYYTGSQWTDCRYRGFYNSTKEVPAPKLHDCMRIQTTDSQTSITTSQYYVFNGQVWVQSNYRDYYTGVGDVVNPQVNDLVVINGVTYWMYRGDAWRDYTHGLYVLINKVIQENNN